MPWDACWGATFLLLLKLNGSGQRDAAALETRHIADIGALESPQHEQDQEHNENCSYQTTTDIHFLFLANRHIITRHQCERPIARHKWGLGQELPRSGARNSQWTISGEERVRPPLSAHK
jgi:hypothetical protein